MLQESTFPVTVFTSWGGEWEGPDSPSNLCFKEVLFQPLFSRDGKGGGRGQISLAIYASRKYSSNHSLHRMGRVVGGARFP